MPHDRSSLPAAPSPADEASTETRARVAKIRRRRAWLGATIVLFGALGLGAFVCLRSERSVPPELPRFSNHVPVAEGPSPAYSAAENDAWETLLRARQRAPQSHEVADALRQVALAHGHAARINESLSAYTQLFALSRPLGAAEIRQRDVADQLGGHFEQQGRMAAREAIWERAYEQRRQTFGRRDDFTLQALDKLLEAYRDAKKLIAIEALLPEFEDAKSAFAFFGNSEKRLEDQRAVLHQRFDLYQSLERPQDQAAALTRLLETHEADEWPLGDYAVIDAALLFHHLGQPARAQDVLRRATKGGNGEGPHLVRQIALAWMSGRADEVDSLEHELFSRNPARPPDPTRPRSTRLRPLAPELVHAETLQALCDLGDFYRRVDQPEAAIRIATETAQFTADAPKFTTTNAQALSNLAAASRRIRDWEEAERYSRGWLEVLQKAPKPDARSMEHALLGLTNACLRQRRYAEAIALRREVIELSGKNRGENDWFVLLLTRRLAEDHLVSGDLATAEQISSELLRRSEELRGKDCDFTAHVREQLALIAWKRKNLIRAAELLVELAAIEKRRLGPEHPGTLYVLRLLGEVRRDQGQFALARGIHQRGLADLLRVHGARHRDVSEAYRALARDYAAENDFVQAGHLYVEATLKAPHAHAAWNNLAWFRATAPVAAARDGAAAVAAAQKACELSAWAEAPCFSTLAAAWAEHGDFEQAMTFQQQALARADLTEPDRNDWEARLALYRDRQPYREPAPVK